MAALWLESLYIARGVETSFIRYHEREVVYMLEKKENLVTVTLPLESLCNVIEAADEICNEYAGAREVKDVIYPAVQEVRKHLCEQVELPKEFEHLRSV
jgi:hypothetical protein